MEIPCEKTQYKLLIGLMDLTSSTMDIDHDAFDQTPAINIHDDDDDEQDSNSLDDMTRYAEDYEPQSDEDESNSSVETNDPIAAALYIIQRWEDKKDVSEQDLNLARYVLHQEKMKLH